MIISGSDITTRSTHTASTERLVHESLRAWVGERPDFEGQGPRPVPAVTATATPGPTDSVTEEASAVATAANGVETDPRLQMLRAMIEAMTGRKVNVVAAADLEPAAAAPIVSAPANGDTAPARAGWGVEYDYQEQRAESEQTTYAARGVVRTRDGQAIAVKLELAMSRRYASETNVSLRAGDGARKDPLVLNFDGTAAELTPARFRFDLNGDGTAEDVPLLAGGHGYLVLDANRNGRVDNGSELFGPTSGQGFAELARHDADGNGWIDGNDPVYARLAVWQPEAAGNGTLTSIADRKVGAIALAATATPFELRSPDNAALGGVRSTSLFLTGDGKAGTVQHIDLEV